MCVFYVLYVFVVSAPFFGLHLFLSFLHSFSFFACSVLYTWIVHVRKETVVVGDRQGHIHM